MIYLDNNATTPLDPKVVKAMEEELRALVGNPSSSHQFGQKAKGRLLTARRKVANYLNCQPHEVIFTSSGTEAINLCIKGIMKTGHLITSDVEHACVNETIESLHGVSITRLPAGRWGAIKPQTVKKAIRPDTKLITLMAANNETGVKNDIKAIAEIALEFDIPFIVDGVALLGKEPLVIPEGVSAMCFSAHKVHGPKGVGCALVRNRLKLTPQISGGAQEYGRRGGTENLVGIVGMAEAIDLLSTEIKDVSPLRDRFESRLMIELGGVKINGEGRRVSNTSNLCFEGVNGESLLAHLDLEGVAVSHGSACSAGALEPSRILLNMGLSVEEASSSLRFSLSRFTTEEEIERAVVTIIGIVTRLRELSITS